MLKSFLCLSGFRRRNRVPGSTRLERIQGRKRAETPCGSYTSDEEDSDYSYPEMSPVCLQLSGAGKDQKHEVCNDVDDANSG